MSVKTRVQTTVSPIDGSVYVERTLASNSDIETALVRSAAAQKAWSRVEVSERAAICHRMSAWCVERADARKHDLVRGDRHSSRQHR